MSRERAVMAAVRSMMRRSEWTTRQLGALAEDVAAAATLVADALDQGTPIVILSDPSTTLVGGHFAKCLRSGASPAGDAVQLTVAAPGDTHLPPHDEPGFGTSAVAVAFAGTRDSFVPVALRQLVETTGAGGVLITQKGVHVGDVPAVVIEAPATEISRLLEAQFVIANCLADGSRAGLSRLDSDRIPPDTFPFVLGRADLAPFRSWVDDSGQILVTTNGCFDGFHLGHQYSLQAARRLGDILVVAVNDDDSVRRLKGVPRPLSSLEARIESLAEFPAVDHVVVMPEMDPRGILSTLRPHVHCKGEDYLGRDVVENETVRRGGGTLAFLPLIDGISTTALKRGVSDDTDLSPADEGVAGK